MPVCTYTYINMYTKQKYPQRRVEQRGCDAMKQGKMQREKEENVEKETGKI